ncbi:MAG: hypothetical protein Q7W29_10140 [bacterium]|nr:hypothetical protein [bacterium]
MRHPRPRSFPAILFVFLIPACSWAQSVSFTPPVSVPVTVVFDVAIDIAAGGTAVMGTEIAATFDPAIVRLDGISAGGWFTAAGQPYYFHDYTISGASTIHFAAALLGDARVADGTLAICHFTALAAGVSPLVFVDVDVRDGTNLDLGAAHSVGDRIIIQTAIPVDASAWGDVKSLWRR